MRIGIVTFYFAHNYGAMLQATAMVEYLKQCGFQAEMIPYFPTHFFNQYNYNPFAKGIPVKRRIYNLLHLLRKIRQAHCFESYKKAYLLDKGKTEYSNADMLPNTYYDIVIYGSDQIWNMSITKNDFFYYGEGIKTRKIAYAASVGKEEVEEAYVDRISDCLKEFQAISVREESSASTINAIVDKKIDVACDPVFLIDVDQWREREKKVFISGKYAIIYLLNKDKRIIDLAIEYSKTNKTKLFCIHPTQDMYIKGIKTLSDVGPQEYLYLLDNAEVIFTNSFHAVSFCAIFKKKLVHIPNSTSPNRTIDLLNMWKVTSEDSVYTVDFSMVNFEDFESFVKSSKMFINRNIKSQK